MIHGFQNVAPPCPTCLGSGKEGYKPCPDCYGTGNGACVDCNDTGWAEDQHCHCPTGRRLWETVLTEADKRSIARLYDHFAPLTEYPLGGIRRGFPNDAGSPYD